MNDRKNKLGLGINILILFATIVVCLFTAEVVLRFVWSGFRPGAHINPLMAYDDTLGWVGKPNYNGQLRESGRNVSCQTNQWGFRDDQPTTLQTAQVKKRLMFLGDSFIMGTGIAKEDRISELIEARDSSFISYNFGIFGYSTDQELLVLKKYGPIIKPDIVLLFFCANDLIYNDSDLGHRIPKGHYRILSDSSLQLGNVPVPKLPEPNPLSKWMKNNLALVQITDKLISQVSFRQKQRDLRPTADDLGLANTGSERADLDSLLLFSPSSKISDLTYYLLREFRDECRRLGAEFILLAIPSNHHWTATREDTPAEILRVLNWCADLKIEAVDLFPAFHRDYAENQKTLYLPDKMHWNERGNQIAAEVLYDSVQKSLKMNSGDTSIVHR